MLTPASLATDTPDCTLVGYLDAPRDQAQVTEPGDVVFLTKGRIRAVVDHQGGHLLAAPLVGIRIHTDEAALVPNLLAALLSDSRIAELATGTKIPSVTYKQVTIPIVAEATAQALAQALEALSDCRLHATRLIHAAEAGQRALAAAPASGVHLD